MIYSGDINDIIKMIKHIQVEYNMSNNDIAANLGKSKQTVSNLLNGRQTNITLDTLLNLCNAVDCELEINIKRKED